MNNWGEFAQVVTAVAALAAFISSWLNRRQIQQIHISINSRMDQLLVVTGAEQHAAGVLEATQKAADAIELLEKGH